MTLIAQPHALQTLSLWQTGERERSHDIKGYCFLLENCHLATKQTEKPTSETTPFDGFGCADVLAQKQ